MNKTTDIIWYSEFLDDYFESIEEIEQGFLERRIDADYWRESEMQTRILNYGIGLLGRYLQ